MDESLKPLFTIRRGEANVAKIYKITSDYGLVKKSDELHYFYFHENGNSRKMVTVEKFQFLRNY